MSRARCGWSSPTNQSSPRFRPRKPLLGSHTPLLPFPPPPGRAGRPVEAHQRCSLRYYCHRVNVPYFGQRWGESYLVAVKIEHVLCHVSATQADTLCRRLCSAILLSPLFAWLDKHSPGSNPLKCRAMLCPNNRDACPFIVTAHFHAADGAIRPFVPRTNENKTTMPCRRC